jgi:methylase of polypeptide subunit release factors
LRRDLGDFQTPPALVSAVLDRLDALGVPRQRVLEPTCGRGHFLAGLLDADNPPAEILGFEIQPDHLAAARALDSGSSMVRLEQADLFTIDLRTQLRWQSRGPLLVVGNPPWVTSAELGRLGSANGPARTRIVGLDGLDARTGRANFDLAEAVWIKLLSELDEPEATIALLCKTSTARNVLRWAARTDRPINGASIHRIDARLWFSATVDACLFVVRLGPGVRSYHADVYPDLTSTTPEARIGVVDGLLVSDLATFERSSSAFGHSTREWRQGIKHDAAGVMELVREGETWRNGLGERVDIEAEHVYPLLKGTDLGRPAEKRPSRAVVVTQHSLGEDTKTLDVRAPRLWTYLSRHAAVMAVRRSKVYEGRPRFCMFGVGDYAFAPHKVAISGMHKTPRFLAIGPRDGRPILLDDTCYLLPCETAREAKGHAEKLNGPIAQRLIAALTFRDAKRPITKAILQRVDIDRLPAPRRRSLASPRGVE